MARFGPTGYVFEIDSVDETATPPTAGAGVALTRITEFNGINEESVVTDLTAFGDDIMSEGAIGLSQFDRIELKGYADGNADSAFRRIGRPARHPAYPARTLTVTHRTGITQTIEVFPVRNRLIPGKSDLTMFEATLAIAAKASADYAETGF